MIISVPVVAVDLGVAEVGHHGLLQTADLSLLLQLPWPQLVLGILLAGLPSGRQKNKDKFSIEAKH